VNVVKVNVVKVNVVKVNVVCSMLKALNAEALKCIRAEMLKLAILFHHTLICVFRLVIILMSGVNAHHEQISVVFGGNYGTER